MSSDDLRPNVYVVMIFFWIMTYVIVGLRIYVRTCVIKSFGRDDVAILIALALFTAYLICQATAVTHGIGLHRDRIPEKDLPIGFAAWLFAEVFYTCSTSVLKIAIGLFLERVTQTRWHVWVIRALMAATALVGSIYFFVALLQCRPLSFYWDFSPNAKGKCISPNVLVIISYIASALNGLADWSFGILPIFVVKDLNMKRNTKIVVAGILGFAAIGSLATLIRLPYVKQLGVYKGDFLYTSTYIAIWSTVEVGIGISASSLATLRPLLHKFFPHLLMDKTVGTVDSGVKWNAKIQKKGRNKHGEFSAESGGSDHTHHHHHHRTVTTIVAGAKAADQWGTTGSQENIIGKGQNDTEMADLKGWEGGISKSVQVTTVEERNSSSASEEERSETPTDVTFGYDSIHHV